MAITCILAATPSAQADCASFLTTSISEWSDGLGHAEFFEFWGNATGIDFWDFRLGVGRLISDADADLWERGREKDGTPKAAKGEHRSPRVEKSPLSAVVASHILSSICPLPPQPLLQPQMTMMSSASLQIEIGGRISLLGGAAFRSPQPAFAMTHSAHVREREPARISDCSSKLLLVMYRCKSTLTSLSLSISSFFEVTSSPLALSLSFLAWSHSDFATDSSFSRPRTCQ